MWLLPLVDCKPSPIQHTPYVTLRLSSWLTTFTRHHYFLFCKHLFQEYTRKISSCLPYNLKRPVTSDPKRSFSLFADPDGGGVHRGAPGQDHVVPAWHRAVSRPVDDTRGLPGDGRVQRCRCGAREEQHVTKEVRTLGATEHHTRFDNLDTRRHRTPYEIWKIGAFSTFRISI